MLHHGRQPHLRGNHGPLSYFMGAMNEKGVNQLRPNPSVSSHGVVYHFQQTARNQGRKYTNKKWCNNVKREADILIIKSQYGWCVN